MIILKYRNIELQVFGEYHITKSSQNVVYSDLKCDFTGHTSQDLPDKYQEVQIIEIEENGNEKILYIGYVESYKFEKMREVDIETDIIFSLFSPKKMATLRTAVAKGTFNLANVISNKILTPLLDDGFVLKEINIKNPIVTLNFLSETVEYCLNNLSNKYNFWWHIDENKNIYINDINTMVAKKPKYIYDENNSIPNLEYIEPTVVSDNYANVINFKDVRVYEYSNIEFNGDTISSSHNPLIYNQLESQIKKNDIIEFNYPCDIAKDNIIKSGISIGKTIKEYYPYFYGINIQGTYSDNSIFEIYIRYNRNLEILETSANIGFEGNELDIDKEFLLTRDAFFNNLIVGFRYNNENKNIKSIQIINSDSALIYNVYKMYNDNAIYSKKGIISDTGIVELTIDMNDSWKTTQELREIGSSYINKNSLKFDGEIKLKLDIYCDIEIGDIIKINKLLFNDVYIVTQIDDYIDDNERQYLITCKNANMLNNFVDVFRGEQSQQNEEKSYKISVVHYEEEKINEVYEVVKW